jgi:hypothetical protein
MGTLLRILLLWWHLGTRARESLLDLLLHLTSVICVVLRWPSDLL